ncbi:hypothetical protein B6I21_00105 [candidate division KSB1 bacterium 4572_119]|nr:MAG: hypothetical protein B6I21_00105 [candidate division KSB1 bacterium 4572_119]
MKENREFEITLIIEGDKVETIFEQISSLKTFGSFHLSDVNTQTIYDIYFDTASDQLKEMGFGLRLRYLNNKKFVTLKGKSRKSTWGGVERVELEYPWNQKGWDKIYRYLNDEIPDLHLQSGLVMEKDAENFIKKAGLRKIQERKNIRQSKFVYAAKPFTCSNLLAELALDSVTLFVGQETFFMYEIEIESKNNGKPADIKEMADLLQVKFGAFIRVYHHSKLTTGKIITLIYTSPEFQGTLKNKNQLAFDSYRLIEDFYDIQKLNGANK